MVEWLPIIIFFLPTLSGFTASAFTRTSVDTWYPKLKKPPFSPPKIVFPIVWTTLYLLMGISGYSIWTNTSGHSHPAKTWFFVQLFFNFMWSMCFFYLRGMKLAFADIIALDISVYLWIQASYAVQPWIGLLQVPYFLWISFATILNASYIYLNN
uniref:Uncharacterized protein n=1 Tax=Panagrolaimus sp. PS1159 TaxID=55785 RepID=A0AC35F1Y3_9BILA